MLRMVVVAVSFVDIILVGDTHGQNAAPPELIVRVTSSDPAVAIAFTAAYAIFDSDLQIVQETTPFILNAKTDVFNGIFQQHSGDAVLEVRLSARTFDKERELATGDGRVVIINEAGGSRSVSSW